VRAPPVVWIRRAVQGLALALFLWLVLAADLSPARPAGLSVASRTLHLFFELDPLVGLTTLLGSGVLYHGVALCLVTVAVTLVLGRVFCGWFCPLGTLQHLSALLRRRLPAGVRRERNRHRPAQRTKYGVLLAGLGLAACGSAFGALLDPTTIAFRGLALGVLPGAGRAARGVMDAAYAAGPPWSHAGDGLRWLIAQGWLPYRDAAFQSGLLLAGVLLLVLGLACWRPRFFCRFVCPLGALLGLLSRWSVLGLRKDPAKCNSCRRCLDRCQGADGPEDGVPWRQAECHKCFNCTASCPEKALAFRFGFAGRASQPAPGAPVVEPVRGPGLSRRTVLATFATGVAAVPLLRISPAARKAPDPFRIRPPGARREDLFLERCIRCGNCMKVCPTNAIQPAVAEAGLEGFWTPVVVPRIGACQPGCTLCGEVCPTGAIREFTAERKLGADGKPPLRIGTARIDRGSCLPWAAGTPCVVCEEFCPTSPKAVRLEPGAAPGGPKVPVIDRGRCNGCGACENVCPLAPAPAIVVTAEGETRARERRPLGR
jgi:polyferredoxin